MKKIRKELLKAIVMLEAARNQKSSVTDRLMRVDGGIALAEMHIDKAKEILKAEMNKHENERQTKNI